MIFRAYHLALTRRSEISHRAKQLKIDGESELEVIHLLVANNAQVVGKTLKEISDQMPAESLLVSIKKDQRLIIPHGDTVVSSGDNVSIILNRENVEEIYQLFQKVEEDV